MKIYVEFVVTILDHFYTFKDFLRVSENFFSKLKILSTTKIIKFCTIYEFDI